MTALAKSSALTSGATFRLIAPDGSNGRREIQLHAERLELHRDHRRGGAAGGRGRQDGEGERAAGQEAGFLAFERNQVRLGQDLQQVLVLQCLDGRADVRDPDDRRTGSTGPRNLPWSSRKIAVLKLKLAEAGRLELLVVASPSVVPLRLKKLNPTLRERHAIDAGELHLQQNLPRLGRGRNLQEIDHCLGPRRRQAFVALGLLGGSLRCR